MTKQIDAQSTRVQQQVRLLPARTEDFAIVATLFEKLHCYNTSLNEMFALSVHWHEVLQEHFFLTHQSPSALWLLAWVGAQPVGFLLAEMHIDSPLFLHRHRIELVALYVEAEYRHIGLAQRLLQASRKWAEDHGEICMQLYVTVQNEQARSFYKKNDWYPVQEIWHLNIHPNSDHPVDSVDPSCLQDRSEYSDVLESGHHHLALKNQQQEHT